MSHHGHTDVEDLIAQEKRLVALEHQNEAWADGVSEGIETDIIADAAFSNALMEIIRQRGEQKALELIEGLRERVLAGEFTPDRTLQ